MKDKGFYLRALLMKLSKKTKVESFDLKGFRLMAEKFTEDTGRPLDRGYLKYKMYDGGTTTRDSKLDEISKYVGYQNFHSFCDAIDLEMDSVLQSVVGDYYCYVRMNKEKGKILRSPVQIVLKDGQIHYHQKGGRLTYTGEITRREGCLFVLMRSDEGKSFYHVYRVGARPSPEVLQGIFSGVSTDFEPIGGRTILWRSDKPFDALKTGKLDIVEMQKSKLKEQQLLAAYFQRKESNNISIKSSYTFGPEDLE
jgi:hypothetical protein